LLRFTPRFDNNYILAVFGIPIMFHFCEQQVHINNRLDIFRAGLNTKAGMMAVSNPLQAPHPEILKSWKFSGFTKGLKK